MTAYSDMHVSIAPKHEQIGVSLEQDIHTCGYKRSPISVSVLEPRGNFIVGIDTNAN